MINRQAQALFPLSNVNNLLAVGFGSGLAAKAPGTFGTLASLPFLLLAASLGHWVFLIITVVMTLLGIGICGRAANNAGIHDHPAIVWDEFCGMFIAMLWLPIAVDTVVIAFIAFRLFDILKPWPISYFDKHCQGGLGIMLDDVLAGLAALVVTHTYLQFI